LKYGLVLAAAVLLAAAGCTSGQAATFSLSQVGSGTGSAGGGEDGAIDDAAGISVFDNDHPAIRNLDPQLRKAVQQAAQDARQRVEFKVTSGWRSKEYQQRLLDEAVDKYGSLAEARKFVSTPETSNHVTGKAVDIGPTNAADWLIQRGDNYGLCQVYSNEMWHFELLTEPGGTCPPLKPNAAG
jgi:zinc D-Ala-D-Ala carboxypeptidase